MNMKHRLPSLAIALSLALGSAFPRADPTDSTEGTAMSTPAIPGWEALVEGLDQLPAATLSKLPQEMRNDPQIRQEVGRLMLQALTLSTISVLGGDGDHPAFLPSIGELINVGQPNADTIYKAAEITPGGVYRLRGHQGSLNMSVIGQVGPTPADPGSEGDHPGPTRNYLYLQDLETDSEGNFDVLLSAEKPDDHDGDWWQLHPDTYRLMMRQVSSDWENEVDPSISIERIDIPVQRSRPTAESMEERLRRVPQMAAFMATMFVDHVVKLRREGYVNKLKVLDVSQIGGLDGQYYYEGAYDLADDEALIIEARHPKNCRYRSVILTNEIYQTADWYNNQSSLNGSQAEVDEDGILRVVVSTKDPGVPNWVDTAGYARGLVQGRWTHCDSHPIPSVKKVALSEVRQHLPENTPVVSPEAREEIIRERRADYQLRRHW